MTGGEAGRQREGRSEVVGGGRQEAVDVRSQVQAVCGGRRAARATAGQSPPRRTVGAVLQAQIQREGVLEGEVQARDAGALCQRVQQPALVADVFNHLVAGVRGGVGEKLLGGEHEDSST